MFHLIVIGVFLGTGADDLPMDARAMQKYNHLRMPAYGTAYKEMLYGFFNDEWAQKSKDGSPNVRPPAYLDGIPLKKIDKMNWKKYPLLTSGYNLRHHVGFGALWFSSGSGFLNRWPFNDIPDFLKRSFEPT